MPYFFCETKLNPSKIVNLAAQETRHLLLSHRARVGETVKLQGPDKKRFLAEILRIGKGVVELKCLQELSVPSEPLVGLVLFQAVIAEKALDFILQKGTELGLEKIVLFNAKNSATKLSKEKFAAKQERWQKILIEAAKQSERAVWPEIFFVSSADELESQFAGLEIVYLTDINGGRPSQITGNGKIGIIVGPEGGFKDEEIAIFTKQLNVQALGLGSVLLRAETAAIAALAGIRMINGF